MSSIIEGYNYDIFISYRQKDNKGDRWVSEFVEALKTELESTFKEEISVYFDINPHDGLLETHDVDASLKDKLKCLIFIPIISRTYCDPKSFAWEHEFKAFVEKASQDQFGLKIKLPNGNVANRVLPVRIYDLDTNDIKLCESILGSVLRSVDFIYKSAGVNRPLRTNEDHPQDNNNKTYYRDQINKVANAIKEIILGFKNEPMEFEGEWEETHSVKGIPTIYEKSIAVLPFVNMSPEKDQDYFCDGITEEIINALAHIENLKVIARTSAFAFKDKQTDIREIGRMLNVGILLEGSIRKADNRLRITAQLIRVADASHIWSERYDREMKDVFAIQDEISLAIADNLKVKLLGGKNTTIVKQHTENLEAYNHYLKGIFYSRMFTFDGFNRASEHYEKALEIDPNYALAYVGLAEVLGFRTFWGNLKPSEGFPKAIEYLNKALSINSALAEAYSALGNLNAFYYWKSKEADRNYRYALQINPNSSMIYMDYACFLSLVGRNEEAINMAERAKVYDPLSWYINARTGDVYFYAGQYDRAIEEYRRTLTINPNYFITHFSLGLSYVAKRKVRKVIAEFEKAVELSNGNPFVMASLIVAYYRIWRKRKANKLFEELKKKSQAEYVPSTCFFVVYNNKGEEEKATEWLRRACIEHDTLLPYIRIGLLGSPTGSKYINLLKEMGMEY